MITDARKELIKILATDEKTKCTILSKNKQQVLLGYCAGCGFCCSGIDVFVPHLQNPKSIDHPIKHKTRKGDVVYLKSMSRDQKCSKLIYDKEIKIFNGYQLAAQNEAELTKEVQFLAEKGIKLKIAAILFKEDQGSQLYTSLKSEAAERVGIEYQVFEFSIKDDISLITERIIQLNQQPSITGIIIQKPWKKKWQQVVNDSSADFNNWWHRLLWAAFCRHYDKGVPAKKIDYL